MVAKAQELSQEAGLHDILKTTAITATGIIGQVIQATSARAEEAQVRASSASLRLRVAMALAKQGHSSPFYTHLQAVGRGQPNPAIFVHQCFTFRREMLHPQALLAGVSTLMTRSGPHKDGNDMMRELLKALAVVAGSSLGVIVCDSQAASAQILEGGRSISRDTTTSTGSKLRIWPLDAITTGPDRRSAQQAAVKALGSGRYMLHRPQTL